MIWLPNQMMILSGMFVEVQSDLKTSKQVARVRPHCAGVLIILRAVFQEGLWQGVCIGQIRYNRGGKRIRNLTV